MNTSIYDAQLLIKLGFPIDTNYGLCYEENYPISSEINIHDVYMDNNTSSVSSFLYSNNSPVQDHSSNYKENFITNTALNNLSSLPVQIEPIKDSVLLEDSPPYSQQYDAETLIALGFPIDKSMGYLYETKSIEGIENFGYDISHYSNEASLVSIPISASATYDTETQPLDCVKYVKPFYPQHLLNISYVPNVF
jgi:hypothetical protein